VRDCHKLGECRPSEERVVCHLEIGYLELQVFSTEVFQSPAGHRKSDLADGHRYSSKDYSVERSPTGMWCRSGQPYLVESLQEQNVQGAVSMDKDSVELDILDDGDNNKRLPTQLWDKVRVVIVVKGDGDLRPL
jgi:hypothetical protein